jgi:periplasmic protein TonB
MSGATSPPFKGKDDRSVGLFVIMLGFSLGAHAIAINTLPEALRVTERPRRVEMEFYEPPPPPKPPEPPKEEPPKPPEPKAKPPPVRVEAPPPKVVAPPPPNEPPPPETPQKPVPIVVGISMSSTTAAGGFAVPVGNTTYGKAPEKITDPSQVKPYAAQKYAPPGGADTEPVPLEEVRPAYPEEAKANEIEGSVKMKLTIDAEGKVISAVVLSGPGYGLNETARAAVMKVRFKPATKNGEAVAYSFPFTYTFILD